MGWDRLAGTGNVLQLIKSEDVSWFSKRASPFFFFIKFHFLFFTWTNWRDFQKLNYIFPSCIFQTIIFQTVFVKTVFVKTVIFQTVFFQTVIFQSVFSQPVFFRTVFFQAVFYKLYISKTSTE